MAISVVALFILGIPYVYFGWKVLLVHFAAMIYNVGVNTHVILYGGTFNRKRINFMDRAAAAVRVSKRSPQLKFTGINARC